MKSNIQIYRGEIWRANLNPTVGREQSGIRPVLILSANNFNQCSADLVVILPLTTKNKHIIFHVSLMKEDSGLDEDSFIKTEDIRSISKERLITFLGKITDKEMEMVEDKTRRILGL